MASTSVVFDILANDRASSKFDAFGRSVDNSGGKLSKFGRGAAKVGKFAAVGFAAVGTVALGVGAKLFQMGDDALDARDRIGNIAESMGIFGNQAGAVTDRLVKFADAQARATGVDQNAIKMTQAKLLTFKELAKSADVAGGSFDRATKAAIDMAAAGFGTAEGNAVQLGKALNDPIKGITALNKAGVTFTESEKKRIETMVAAGKGAKAQAFILSAIEKQVGGTAEAMAGPFDRLKVTFSQLAERVGMKLAPAVESLSAWVLAKGLPAMKAFGAYLQTVLPPIFDKVRGAISQFTGEGSGKFSKFVADTKAIFTDGIAIVQNLWRLFGANILGYLKSTFANIKTVLSGAFDVIRGIFKTVSALLKGDWKKAWEGIKLILRGAGKIIIGLVRQTFNLLRFAFKNAGVILKKVWQVAWDGIKALAKAGAQWLVDRIKAIPGAIKSLAGNYRAAGSWIMAKLWDIVKEKVRTGASNLVADVRAIPGKLKGLGGGFVDAGKALIGKFFDGLKKLGDIGANVGSTLIGGVISGINSGIGAINSAIPDKLGLGKFSVDLPNNPFPTIGGYARGTSSARRGWAMVGEDGPELMRMRGGEQVFTASQTRGMLAGGRGRGDDRPIVVQVYLDGKMIEQSLVRRKRTTGRPLQFQATP